MLCKTCFSVKKKDKQKYRKLSFIGHRFIWVPNLAPNLCITFSVLLGLYLIRGLVCRKKIKTRWGVVPLKLWLCLQTHLLIFKWNNPIPNMLCANYVCHCTPSRYSKLIVVLWQCCMARLLSLFVIQKLVVLPLF